MDNLQPVHSMLHSFCIKPNVKFETQNDQEEVILVLRAHPITQIGWIINSFIFLIVFILLNFFLPSFLSPTQIFFADIFGLAVIFSYVFFNFLSWFFNLGIVTNQRIVDVDFHAVIYKEVTETVFAKVEDVTDKSAGFFASIFDYGNVFIQTAGTEINIEFINIPKPSDVVKIIENFVPQQP